MAECGLACIAMIAAYFGHSDDLVGLRRRFGVSLKGANLASLVHIGESLQLSARAVRCGLSDLERLRTPCILHWEFNHFVVLRRAKGRHVLVHDPAHGALRMSVAEVDAKFTGVALEFVPSDKFRQRKPRRRLKLADLVTTDRSFVVSIAAALLLAIVSELLLLATPFYLQTVIDQVLMRGDHSLLNTLAIGFSALALFQLVASGMRQLTFQFLSQVTVFSLSSRILRHLLHLPVSWFRSRRLGDIQQRMQSLVSIQAFITQAAPALVIDGIFLVIVVVLMLTYAPTLTGVVTAVGFTYLLWRALIFPTMLEQANKLVRAEAAAQSHLLESLRSMQSIKMTAGESQRTQDWRNLFVRRVNTQLRAGNIGIVDRSIYQGLVQSLHIAIVYFLARQVEFGEMSVGAVSAFVAYTGMFMTRAGGIINRVFEYRLLQVPLDRLADIVFNEAELYDQYADRETGLTGNVRASDVTFAYAGTDSPVFQGLSFEVARGELVAIRGSSGCGKSTLLRILSGAEQATSGGVYFDGKPAGDWPLGSVRRSIATVFHDDALISGSIAENIAMFDHERNEQRMREAAECAAIAGTIEALPMAYDTPIGDLGSALSTGQVQRILFARALYRRPSILLLDEFTSGLDEDTERHLINSLVSHTATRIVVTHSAAVLRAADRVYQLRDGCLTPC